MTGLIATLFVTVLLLPGLARPFFGLAAYYWFCFVAFPPKLWGGFDPGWAKILAISTLLAWILSREPKRVRFDASTTFVALFFAWTVVTTLSGPLFPEKAYFRFGEFAKVNLMLLCLLALVSSRQRQHMFLWAMAIAIGYNTVFIGAATFFSGGGKTLSGIALYGDENATARAIILTLPLFGFLFFHSQQKLTRWALLAAIGFSVIGLMGTGSRGGFVAFAAMCAWGWLRSRRKVFYAVIGFLCVAVGTVALSDRLIHKWGSRMQTLEEASQVGSFQQRVAAWKYAIEVANRRPLTGGGFAAFKGHITTKRAGTKEFSIEAHNSFFQALGDHGYVGLAFFVSMLAATFWSTIWIQRRTRARPDLRYERDFALMMQLALVGYLVGSLTHHHTYYEPLYVMIGLIALTRRRVVEALGEQKPVSAFARRAGEESALAPGLPPPAHPAWQRQA